MKWIKLKVEYLDHAKVLLTNSRGDTFSSKSEELKDFLHDEPESPSSSGETLYGERIYRDYKPHEDDHTLEAWYFEAALAEEKKTGYTILGFSSWDGSGYWVKDGKKSSDEIFSTPRLDATHIVWYNK